MHRGKNEFQNEWMVYKTIIKNNFDKMKIETILPILIKEYLDVFPNIIRLIKIAYTIPFSSVPCERGFSKQNLIKTKNRNNLSIDTLDKLLRVSLEDESVKNFDYKSAYHNWNSQKRRYFIK